MKTQKWKLSKIYKIILDEKEKINQFIFITTFQSKFSMLFVSSFLSNYFTKVSKIDIIFQRSFHRFYLSMSFEEKKRRVEILLKYRHLGRIR